MFPRKALASNKPFDVVLLRAQKSRIQKFCNILLVILKLFMSIHLYTMLFSDKFILSFIIFSVPQYINYRWVKKAVFRYRYNVATSIFCLFGPFLEYEKQEKLTALRRHFRTFSRQQLPSTCFCNSITGGDFQKVKFPIITIFLEKTIRFSVKIYFLLRFLTLFLPLWFVKNGSLVLFPTQNFPYRPFFCFSFSSFITSFISLVLFLIADFVLTVISLLLLYCSSSSSLFPLCHIDSDFRWKRQQHPL